MVTRPAWAAILRALREAAGVSQEGWATQLGVGRTTLQRWERGELPPDAHAESALLALCRERGLYRRYEAGPLMGLDLTAEWLAALLAAARLGRAAPAVPTPVPAGRLIERTGPRAGTVHVLRENITTIGCIAENAICIELEGVSKRHAEVRREADGYSLVDLNSKNGTYRNGRRLVGPERLVSGDVIALPIGLPGEPMRLLAFQTSATTATVRIDAFPTPEVRHETDEP